MNIQELIKNRILFFDGGMGTLLQSKGLKGGELPESWNMKHPEIIEDIHKMYLSAGADIITTNTFGANALKLESDEFDTETLVEAGVKIAQKAVKESGHGYIALGLGPTGKLLEPLGDITFEMSYNAYAQMIKTGVKAGVDLILFETMGDAYEIKAGVLAAKENSELPVFVTMIFNENHKLLTGGDIKTAVCLLEGLGVDAIGCNCGRGPDMMLDILLEMRKYTSLPIIINSNAGLPKVIDGCDVFQCTPSDFSTYSKALAENGANFLGGCCGTTPEHISEMTKVCRNIPPLLPEKKDFTMVSSYGKCLIITDDPIIIGERINPTGKPKLREALKNMDLSYILNEAVSQESAGSNVLDVNTGIPNIDEPKLLCSVVKAIQAVTDLPLQIDTSDYDAMEAAARIYNGKPMLNSVNGKKESMDKIFPIAKKYGGVLIGLTLDENIPQTAEGRFEIAERIVNEASKYGIDKKNIVIDPLTMTVSADKDSAKITLDAMKLIRERLGVKIALGVSNISFGLPQRMIINSHFFTLAMMNGLSCAIINPLSEKMLESYHSYRALMGYDENFESYISAYSEESAKKEDTKESSVSSDLGFFIKKGLKENASSAAKILLSENAPMDIITNILMPALDEVGKGFEKGTVFLPQLLMSADAAKEAFAIIKKSFETDTPKTSKGDILLATVKGDIHDIGKNIVKVLLENYEFNVLDLGKDVPAETIVNEAKSRNIKLIALSALMTTTVKSMAETIILIRKELPDAKVMVGGAVLNPEFAKEIGADFYGANAMESVTIAKAFFEK